MRRRTQKSLAELASVTSPFLTALKAGTKNASPKNARLLGELTNTDPWLWMLGGKAEIKARRAAMEAWFKSKERA
jgi:hypothetical protein